VPESRDSRALPTQLDAAVLRGREDQRPGPFALRRSAMDGLAPAPRGGGADFERQSVETADLDWRSRYDRG